MINENSLEYININGPHSNSAIFQGSSEGEPMLKLCKNGDIYIRGKLIENDKEVVDGMRDLLGILR